VIEKPRSEVIAVNGGLQLVLHDGYDPYGGVSREVVFRDETVDGEIAEALDKLVANSTSQLKAIAAMKGVAYEDVDSFFGRLVNIVDGGLWHQSKPLDHPIGCKCDLCQDVVVLYDSEVDGGTWGTWED
jgi:hypothetical protein